MSNSCSRKRQVPTRQMPWPRRKTRRVSVSNFGFGGSNAHLIIEQAPSTTPLPTRAINGGDGLVNQLESAGRIHEEPTSGERCHLIVLSANDEGSLKRQAHGLVHYLKHRPQALYRNLLPSLALTLQRSFFQWRIALNTAMLRVVHDKLDEGKVPPGRVTRDPVLDSYLLAKEPNGESTTPAF